jgi:hypothetical protein
MVAQPAFVRAVVVNFFFFALLFAGAVLSLGLAEEGREAVAR